MNVIINKVGVTMSGICSLQGEVMNKIDNLGCKVILGDFDYVAKPTIIRDCFEFTWNEWESKINYLLKTIDPKITPLVSLYARVRGVQEAQLLEQLSHVANNYPDLGVLFHFFDVEAMSRALDIYRGRPLINYVSGEKWALERILPLLKRHPVPIVIQPIGDMGIPPTVNERMEIIQHIANTFTRVGIDRRDIYVDGLTPALGTLEFSLQVSLKTITAAKEAGFETILWPANAGLGHPDGKFIAATYAAMAVQAGLDLAVVASADREIYTAIAQANLILRDS